MKRILLGLICALTLAAFATTTARADEKPADTGTTTAPKKHKKHKKKAAAATGDKTDAAGTTK